MSSEEVIAVRSGDFGWKLKRVLRPALPLVIVIAAAALFLTLVNALTAGPIAARQEETRRAAMESVMPGANVFSELYTQNESIERLSGAYAGTVFLGYCVEVTVDGFVDEISLLVGVDGGGAVTGVLVLDHAEHADLGAKAAQPEFLRQYVGKSGTVTVNSGRNAVNAVSGATVTSKAVTAGINTALTAVLHYIAEGGQVPDDGNF